MAKKWSSEKFKGKLHYHPCISCGIPYTCPCKTPAVDDLCNLHSPLRLPQNGPTVLYTNRLPQQCCFIHARSASTEDRNIYRLAGPGPWWICRLCFRQFGFFPGSNS